MLDRGGVERGLARRWTSLGIVFLIVAHAHPAPAQNESTDDEAEPPAAKAAPALRASEPPEFSSAPPVSPPEVPFDHARVATDWRLSVRTHVATTRLAYAGLSPLRLASGEPARFGYLGQFFTLAGRPFPVCLPRSELTLGIGGVLASGISSDAFLQGGA